MEGIWRVCEGDEGGEGFQACEIVEEGGRKGVDVVLIEGLREE